MRRLALLADWKRSSERGEYLFEKISLSMMLTRFLLREPGDIVPIATHATEGAA
jgi:hypothetical protein